MGGGVDQTENATRKLAFQGGLLEGVQRCLRSLQEVRGGGEDKRADFTKPCTRCGRGGGAKRTVAFLSEVSERCGVVEEGVAALFRRFAPSWYCLPP